VGGDDFSSRAHVAQQAQCCSIVREAPDTIAGRTGINGEGNLPAVIAQEWPCDVQNTTVSFCDAQVLLPEAGLAGNQLFNGGVHGDTSSKLNSEDSSPSRHVSMFQRAATLRANAFGPGNVSGQSGNGSCLFCMTPLASNDI
jgi:hypothetical protein